MKPVAICRYSPTEGPGYFATYLTRRNIPWRLIKVDEAEPLPQLADVGGLAMMGGPMSVNDDLPWIPVMLELIGKSVASDVPVIGHCLGGQLLAKALGGRVTRNAVQEIGWHRIDVLNTPASHHWGPAASFVSFHWHGDTFSVPSGAIRIWSSAHCGNQAFVRGMHIGMQCHVEITEALIESWCETGADEIERERKRSPAVQTAASIREGIAANLDALRAVADRVYDRWVEALR